MTDKPKKPARDIKDLKAKLGLAKPGAKPPGGAVPPPGGAVPPPGGAVPPPGGAVPPPGGIVPPTSAVSRPGGGVVPPTGYQQPQPQQAVAAAGIGDDLAGGEDEFSGKQMHGKKELIFRIVLGSLAVVAFFVGTQCGKTVIIRGWVNKVTEDSQKIVESLQTFNQAVRRIEALEQQYPLTDQRGGGMIETYSPDFGNQAEPLVGPLENLREAEIFGIFYNMLSPADQPVVGQLFTYFALLKQLRETITAMRSFEFREREALNLITAEGREQLKRQQQETRFGAFFTGPRSVALTILEPEAARCGPKLDRKCKDRQPDGYVLEVGGEQRTFQYNTDNPEERVLDLDLGGMGGLADCFGGSTDVQQQLSRAQGAWQIYLQYRVAVGRLLREIDERVKPTEVLRTYEKYATRSKINRYIIF